MRRQLTRETMREPMRELARTAPSGERYRVFVVGGGTAVLEGWRPATIDADLYAEDEAVFRDVQEIPYAQLLSKVVRGFRKDLLDAERFVRSGMVDPERFRELVREIPDAAYARYPNLGPAAVLAAVEEFLSDLA